MLWTKANPIVKAGTQRHGASPQQLEGGGQPGYLEDPTPGNRQRAREVDTGSLSIAIHHKETHFNMLRTFKERREQEEGFTLIELMVVVLIIAILLAIAIPTFLGARERANDRAAQSSLRNAVTAAKTMYTDSQNYAVATAASLQVVEPSLTFQTGASVNYKQVQVDETGNTATKWSAATLSKSGVCFVISDSTATGGGTWYAKKTGSNTTCEVSDAVPTASTSW